MSRAWIHTPYMLVVTMSFILLVTMCNNYTYSATAKNCIKYYPDDVSGTSIIVTMMLDVFTNPRPTYISHCQDELPLYLYYLTMYDYTIVAAAICLFVLSVCFTKTTTKFKILGIIIGSSIYGLLNPKIAIGYRILSSIFLTIILPILAQP